MKNAISLPIRKFEKTKEVIENTNFHKVKIMILHTGENYNGSIFSEESITQSIHTLSNIPILGFINTSKDGEKDFAGHETELEIFTDEEGTINVKEIYKEVPIGVIPESNEWFSEEIDGEIYFGCYGYIWKCYSNDAYDILLEEEEKEVSMEILINQCSYDKSFNCHIDKFEFLGVTVLGNDYPGAMGEHCTINMNFSAEHEEKEFFASVDKLNKILKLQRKEDIMENQEINEIEEVCPICKENPCVCEDKEEAKVEMEEKEICPTCKQDPCVCEDKEEEVNEKEVVEEDEEKDKEEYAEKTEEIEEEKDEDKGKEEFKEEDEEICPICKQDPCVCEDKEEEACKEKKDHAKEEEVVEEDDKEKEEEIVDYKCLYEEAMAELEELRKFKEDIEQVEEEEKVEEEIKETLSQFAFEEEEVSELKAKVFSKEIDMAMFETLLFALEAKKARAEKEKFAKLSEGQSLNITDVEEDKKPLGKYSDILQKYGKKNK